MTPMNRIDVQPVRTARDSKLFVRFPWKLYQSDPQWVPPLLMDRKKLIDRQKNPFYKHAEAEFFLAYRDGEMIGRIGAIVNHNHQKEHRENIGFFGFFESVDDQAAATALFEAAKSWLRERHVEAIRGPANPSVNDEYGLLVEGFDRPPMVMMPYNPPYYGRLIEGSGLAKVKDMYAYLLRGENVITDRLARVSDLVRQREGFTFRSLNMKDFAGEIERIKRVYNRAWQYNWGAVPMTDDEFDAMAKDMKAVVNPELVVIAELRGEPIGFSLSLPDLNVALKYNRGGYLLPGLVRLMWHKKEIKMMRIIALGVVREHLKTGAANVLFYETAKRGISHGFNRAEASWVLEDNTMMNRAAEFLNAERYKVYRLYQSTL
jgi:hypothetical protein